MKDYWFMVLIKAIFVYIGILMVVGGLDLIVFVVYPKFVIEFTGILIVSLGVWLVIMGKMFTEGVIEYKI